MCHDGAVILNGFVHFGVKMLLNNSLKLDPFKRIEMTAVANNLFIKIGLLFPHPLAKLVYQHFEDASLL